LNDQAERPYREEDTEALIASLRVECDALLQERERLRAEIAQYKPWSPRRFWLGASLTFVGTVVVAFLRSRFQ
jgi:hypothetical protein